MTPTAPGSAAADRADRTPDDAFRRALAELWPEAGLIGLAVSGGADSLAMLLLAHATIPGRFEVATVDHRLRPAGADECAFVAQLCAARGISCAILPISVPADGNVMAAARTARYAALAHWAQARGLGAIATAHHIDDQAETLLMRLSHASGVAGLAGIRRRGVVPGSDLPLLRPLLTLRRADCEDVVARAGIDPVQDPSNDNPAYSRVRIRQALRTLDGLDAVSLAASATNLADAEDVLAWATDREWAERVTIEAGILRYRPGAPRAVMLRVLDRAVRQQGALARWQGAPARGQGVARVLDRLLRGEDANIAGVLIRIVGQDWLFAPEPPRKSGSAGE
ncbi:tRNA lysidine(34) synthetase TilS [Altererythrobacter xixiisoli]|uniref:tRNA(Ile)-lysidine synthase n=1 Tax=Croceibacterium xixiisoli TaxID=1476466 RepID=A0A6I4TT58_9SPHN|nr:tRNA lysidine(34) synthetase TilS [Croceibacterium xixiisoli]MXO98057.1 tRNA lysidine(34) synthetase TilS [Croceibacterium xixiisoli]